MIASGLNIVPFLEKSLSLPVTDVRSPAEFEHGHIPGAFNLPLFNNDERALIGTLYHRQGSSEAVKKGLEIVGPKMKTFAELAQGIAPGGEMLVHCWRGGMRSNSMAWLMNTIGIKAQTLEGGYKSYRKHVLSSFLQPLNLVVIGGMTGSGKTRVLEKLENQNMQVVHLERMANHKGSAFGGISMPNQPTTEQFENNLHKLLNRFGNDKKIYIEDESIAIGKVFLPQPLYRQMSAALFVNLVVPKEKRVEHLVNEYTRTDKNLLINCIKRIEKRVGTEKTKQVINYIENDKMEQAVDISLIYYDKLYTRSMEERHNGERIEIVVTDQDYEEIAAQIIDLTRNI